MRSDPGFNPRAPRGARPPFDLPFCPRYQVSIHAPRAGRDVRRPSGLHPSKEFQSTRPARGATAACAQTAWSAKVSIHAPRAGRDATALDIANQVDVSIHAPRAGRDEKLGCAIQFSKVSIHAPRAGRDNVSRALLKRRTGFNPRAPRGARQRNSALPPLFRSFQSTRPARGATDSWFLTAQTCRVSIHAPRAGRDAVSAQASRAAPVSIHAPRAGRDPLARISTSHCEVFQSTRPARGATSCQWRWRKWKESFNPRAPRGARQMNRATPQSRKRFNPRAPRGARQANSARRARA